MPYSIVADSFRAKKLCSRLFPRKYNFVTKNGHFAFLSPPLGSFGATHAVHFRLIGKRVVDFLLVIMELFR